MSEYDDAVADFGAAKQRLRPSPLSDGGIAMPTAPAVAADPYEAAVDGLLAGRRNAAVGNMLGAGDANPDAAGRAMTIAPQTGVPAGVVETALPDYEAKIRLQRNNAVIAKNPALTDWLAGDPMHARVSSDDFDKLDVVSKTWRSFKDGWMMALQGNERGRLGSEAMVGADVRLRLRKIDRELAQHPELDGIYGKLQTLSGFAGGMLDNFIRGSLPTAVQGATVGLVTGGAAGGAATAPAGGVGAVPGAAAGSLTGAVTGAVVGFNYDAARVAAGNVYLNLSETRGENGEQISTPIKEGAAIITGIATYALNNVGFKAAGRTLEQAIAHAATKPTVGRAIGNFAMGLAKTGAQGAALNTAMTGTAIFAEEFAKVVADGDYETAFNNPLQRQQVIDQLITAATDGAMFFPIIHAANPMRGGGVRTLVTETFQAKQAKADTEAFQALETGATESLTRGRSLTAFQSFMRSQTDGSPVENIAVTGDAMRTLYQSAGKEPGPGDGLLGDIVPDLREQMRQASETGGDIVVPTAAYVAHLAGTPISESLRGDIRFRPDGMTMREAEAYEAMRGEHLAELARAGRAAAEDVAAAAEPIRQVQADIEHKLRLAGQTADAAAQYAALVAARYQARAETFGGSKGTALDLYRAEGLDVRRETPESLRRVEADESDLVINALRNDTRKAPNARTLFGPSLHEAVKAAGGIVDTGGELRAMDLDKAKVRGIIRKATGNAKDDIEHSVDAMGLRLWEMGYFPELIERPTPDQLFDAMRRGDERYSEGAGNERKAAFEDAVADLDEFTSRLGIDVKKASNEEIKAAIKKALADEDAEAGRTLMQVTPDTAGLTTVEFGKFKTGKPVTFKYLHNTDSATKIFGKPEKGDRFARDLEPSGRYLVEDDGGNTEARGTLTTGIVTFNNPLVMDGTNWKQELAAKYGKTGKELSQALIRDGYDGVVTISRSDVPGRTHTSEILDLTTFDSKRALYQSEKKRELIIQHNMSAENLMHSDRMGGIAAPSLAITKAENSLTGFGEITLIGPKEMADPKWREKPRVFGADIYSPRYPEIVYKPDASALKKINAKLAPYREKGEREIYSSEVGKPDDLFGNKAFEKYAAENFMDKRTSYVDRNAAGHALLQEAEASEKIFRGFTNNGNRRYTPHTLENVVSILKKELRGGEGFNYGVGSLRAKFTPEFRSVEQIKKNADRLVSKEIFEKIKKEIDDEFWVIAEKLQPYSNRGKEFGFGDAVINAMSEAPKIGLRRALNEYNINDVPSDVLKTAAEFLEKLRHLPTEYFEAKILRGVGVSEFELAAIPNDLSPKVKSMLERRGIQTVEYKRGDEADRRRVINEISNQYADRVLFQGERGKITLDNGRATITLFKDADLSTFLHETGHLWLDEVSRDALDAAAPEGLRADASTVAKWLGAEDLTNLTVEQHEQFARGFETYLLEGRAPSSALASAFRKFKSWLIRIYKTAAGLNVPMSDEIRGVFDRMLASEEEIAGWRQTESLNPVFASAKDAGMTDAEFTAYTKAVERSRNQADERMTRKAMASVRRARTDEWKAEAANVRAEVEPEVKARRDLKAQYYLRTGKMLDEPDSVAQPDHVRLSKAALEDMYGTDEVSKAIPRGIIAVKDGAHPDELADLFGYRSGDEMVRDLMTLEASRKQAETATGKSMSGEKYVSRLINDEVQRIMLERHGDALNDGSIEAEAMFAVHNAAQADVMAAESRAIARQAGVTALRLDDIKAWADGEIANMSTKRGTNMSAFARTEAKWGREVQRALLKGNHMAAFEAKQKQLINHILATKAGEAAEEYAASFNALRKLGKTARRETIQQSFMDQIHSILERLDIPVKRSEADAIATPSLREFANTQAGMEIGQDFFVPGFLLDERWTADARDMPLGQYFEAAEAVTSLANLGRRMREMEVDGEKIRFSDIIDQMRTQLGGRAIPSAEGMTSPVSNRSKNREGLLGVRASLRRVEGWARLADGGDINGPFNKYIVRPMYEALDKYRPEKTKYLQKLWDIVEPRRKDLTGAKIFVPEINFTFDNKGQLLHAILHTGNESNLRKLLLGYGWGERAADGGVDRSRWDAGVARLIDSGWLKKEDFDTAQAIWDLMEELKEPAQKANKEIYGVRFDEVTAQKFQTPFGEYRGGYAPAITDRYIVKDGQERADAEALKEQQTGAMFPSTGRGFTKSRNENYTKPLELNLSRIPSHIDSVLKFTHLQPTVRDLGRLMLKRSFKDLMHDTDRAILTDMFMPWLRRTATQTLTTPAEGVGGRWAASVTNAARRRSSMQILAFNVSNSLQQLVGIPIAFTRVPKAAAMRSLMTYVRQPGAVADEIAAKSSFMDERMTNKSSDLSLEIEAAFRDPSYLADAQKWSSRNSSILQHMFQNIVDITTWKAAYEHEIGKGTLEADAVAQANEIVRATQGGFAPEDLSAFETQGAVHKLFVSNFYSYFGGQANMLATEFGLTKNIEKSDAMKRRATVAFWGIIAPAVLSDLIYKSLTGADDDEDGDKSTMLSLAMYFLGTTGRYLAGMVPVIGPVAVAGAEMLFTGDISAGDRIGTSPTAGAVKVAAKTFRDVPRAVTGEGAPGPAVRDVMTALGLILGVPLGQAGKAVGYGADVASGWQKPENARDVVRGLATGKQKGYQ